MIDKSSRFPGNDFNPMLSSPFIIITSANSKNAHTTSRVITRSLSNSTKISTHLSTTLCTIELKSLGLGEFPELMLGIERIPSAKRIKIRKVNMISIVRNMVDDDDFRAGWREYLGFAIASETREIEIWNFLDSVFKQETQSRACALFLFLL